MATFRLVYWVIIPSRKSSFYEVWSVHWSPDIFHYDDYAVLGCRTLFRRKRKRNAARYFLAASKQSFFRILTEVFAPRVKLKCLDDELSAMIQCTDYKDTLNCVQLHKRLLKFGLNCKMAPTYKYLTGFDFARMSDKANWIGVKYGIIPMIIRCVARFAKLMKLT